MAKIRITTDLDKFDTIFANDFKNRTQSKNKIKKFRKDLVNN